MAQYVIRDSTKNIIVAEGFYQGKNIFVLNPYEAEVKNVFCSDSIFINGKPYIYNFKFRAYEIKLDSFISKIGSPYKVAIYHNEFCTPQFLTQGWGPLYVSQVKFTSFVIDSCGDVYLTTINGAEIKGERPDLKISQLRGNKWTTILYIPQKKGIKNTYNAVVTLVPGINKLE